MASSVAQVIGELQGGACIDNSGIASALDDKLATAQAEIGAGQTQYAIATMNALLNQLRSQVGKHVSTTCVYNGQSFNPDAVLITDVQWLQASL